jgi:hypothetical protein
MSIVELRVNIATRANIAPRQPDCHFTQDERFLRNVRGRAAVFQVLEALGHSRSVRAADPVAFALVQRGVLREEQLLFLEEDTICVNCDRLPVGLDFCGRKSFRCDRPDCK